MAMSSSSSVTASNSKGPPSSFPFPNAIPPRTSSNLCKLGLTSQAAAATINSCGPAKPVPRPVAEADWIAGSTLAYHSPTSAYSSSSKAPVRLVGPPTAAHKAPLFATGSTRSTSTMSSSTLPSPTAPDPNRYSTEDFNFSAKRTWTREKEKLLVGPYDYLIERPGKDFRTLLVQAFDAWLEVPSASLAVITKVIGMLHTASLLVDDVEDNSLLRRGFPVAHSIFGVPQTINSSNYVYFLALQELQKLQNPEAISIYAEELVNLHRGQGMDLFWRDSLTCPTEDDYLEMVGNKTGGLFRLGIKLMQAESRRALDCVPLVNIIGLTFQILDDYQNLWSQDYTDNKGMCEDLTEGKFSFPVIHSIRSDPTNLQLLNILKQKTTNEEIKRYAVNYMESTGSFEYTRQVLRVLIERARAMIDELEDGKGKSGGVYAILERLSAWMGKATP